MTDKQPLESDSHASQEDQLRALTPTGSPTWLRQRTLDQLKSGATVGDSVVRSQRHLPSKRITANAANLALATLVFLAPMSWGVLLVSHHERMANMLGPTPLERRVDRTLDRLGIEETSQTRLALQTQLRALSIKARQDLRHDPQIQSIRMDTTSPNNKSR